MQLTTGALGRVISCASLRSSPRPAQDTDALQRLLWLTASLGRLVLNNFHKATSKLFELAKTNPHPYEFLPSSFVNKNRFSFLFLHHFFSHLIFSSESNSLPTPPFLCIRAGDLIEQGGDPEEINNSSQK